MKTETKHRSLERENYIKDYIAQFLMGTAKQTMEPDAFNDLVRAQEPSHE